MRQRVIKPEFMDDEDLALVSRDARLVFIYLLLAADREGILLDQPVRLARKFFPYEPEVDIEPWLHELATTSKRYGSGHFIKRYEVDGRRYIIIPKFKLYQPIHPREMPSRFPKPRPASDGHGRPREAVDGNGEQGPTTDEQDLAVESREEPRREKPHRLDFGTTSVPSVQRQAFGDTDPPNSPPVSAGGAPAAPSPNLQNPLSKAEAERHVNAIVAFASAQGYRFDRRDRRAIRERLLGGERVDQIRARYEEQARELEALDAWEPVPLDTLPAEVQAFLADFPEIDGPSAVELWPGWAAERGVDRARAVELVGAVRRAVEGISGGP